MGLSSSQARLLNLTSRMHQIEYKAAKLEAEKLQMANESDRVYNEYLEALEKTKIQCKKLTSEGAVTYVDMQNYQEFWDAGFALVYNGFTYANLKSDGTNFYVYVGYECAPTDPTEFAAFQNGAIAQMIIAEGGTVAPGYAYHIYNDVSDGSVRYSSTPMPYNSGSNATWNQLLNNLGVATPISTDFETVLTNVINSGMVTIVAKDPENANKFWQPYEERFHLFETSVSTNTGLQEVQDEVNLKKAEAKYEADMRKIDNKDKKFDTELATLDNERNAIKNEMDTLKSVAKDNVDRTYKLFS